MGVCYSTKLKPKNQTKIQSAVNNNHSQPNLQPTLNPTKQSDQFEEMRSKLRKEIKESPFNNYGHLQQEELESEYNLGKYPNPYLFIKTKSYPSQFTQLYSTCYLKCEPILNIITDDKRKGNLLFFRIVIFLLSNVNDIIRKIDTAKRIVLESYEPKHQKINIENLKNYTNAVIELCIEVIIYFGLIPLMITKEKLIRVLTEDIYSIQDKYHKVELDDYYFDHSIAKTQLNFNEIKNNWINFIFIPLLSVQQREEQQQQSLQIRESRFSFAQTTSRAVIEITEAGKEEIIARLAFTFDSLVLFNSMVNNEITGFSMGLYK